VVDKVAYLHKNANMRTSLDLPDPLFRTLKANAALQGTSLRDHVIALIERGMNAPLPAANKPAKAYQVPPIPTLPAHYECRLPPELMTNAGINEFLDREELEKYWNVIKYGRGSGPLTGESAEWGEPDTSAGSK
jgi:hypothetical protein